MFNEATLIGRLGKEPELRHTQNGTPVCSLWLATSEVTNKDGNKKEHTEWHSVVVWSKSAEHCKQYLHKGSLVFVKGRIASREYTDKDGVKKKQSEIIAHTVKFLTPRQESSPAASGDFPQNSNQVHEPVDGMSDWDSIPF